MSFIAEHTDRLARLRSTLDTAWRRALGIGIIAGSVVFAACSKPVPQRPPAEVTVAPAVARQVSDWDEFSGHFESVDAVEIRPRVSGFVQRVAFAEGAIVRRGDPLFYIDAGVGVRVHAPGLGGTVRIDIGRGLRDGRMSSSAGWISPWPR